MIILGCSPNSLQMLKAFLYLKTVVIRVYVSSGERSASDRLIYCPKLVHLSGICGYRSGILLALLKTHCYASALYRALMLSLYSLNWSDYSCKFSK